MGATENLVGFGLTFPFLAALAIIHLLVNPGDQAAGQRCAEILGRQIAGAEGFRHDPVNVQNRRSRISQLVRHCAVNNAHLLNQFAHVLRASTRGSLIGHGAQPFHQPMRKQSAQTHQHQTDGAVAPDVVLGAPRQRSVNHRAIHRIENDHGVIFHPQG